MKGTWAIVGDKIYLQFDLPEESDLDTLASVTKELEEFFNK